MGQGILNWGEGELREASFSQERLWFMQELAPGACVFNMLNGFVVRGSIDVDAFRRSILEIVRRHEVLRTNLVFSNGKVWQSVSPVSDRVFEYLDLSGMPEGEGLEEGRKRALGWARKPYDLSKDSLFKAVLIKTGAAEHLIALLTHHAVFDGWSLRIFAGELVQLYSSFVRGEPSPLLEPEMQYWEYSRQQRQRYTAGEFETELEYWEEKLGGGLPVLELQTDRPRRAEQEFQGDLVRLLIPAGLRDRLKRLGTLNGCTLYMTLLAAFYIFLSRYSGAEDLVVGCPVAGRGTKSIEGTIGFFINTLPLRCDLSGSPTFVELLKKVRKLCLDGYRNQNIPFDRVVERLDPERDLAHSPIYQVIFQLRNYPNIETRGAGLSLEEYEFGWVTSQVDLMVDMQEVEGGLRCDFEYPTALFDRATIERMAGHWLRLLEGIAESPESAISKFPIMSDMELRELVYDRNRTQTDYPRDRCVQELFEDWASRSPDSIAITHGSASLTYREVNERANQLAHLLLDGGLSPGEPVGVCMERSPDMIIAYIAILKAGAPYVPLDPSDPPSRLGVIVNDMRGRTVVTKLKYVDRLPLGTKLICLDREQEALTKKPKTNTGVRRRPTDMAYIIYTSGSTGAPKGVCCPHRGIVRLVVGTNYVHFSPGDTIVHASNPTFDPTTFEVWGALLNGARLLIVDKEVLLSNQEFPELLRREGADTLFMTTTLFHLKARDAPWSFGSLREVFVGGEAMEPFAARKVLEASPPKRLINFYGPTENTGFSTYYEVKDIPEGAVSIPIGKNISNSTSYILDRHLQPVPIGVKGEIYVSGDGVSLGYFGKPELTALSFLPNPFSQGQTMYRTGDLGRFLPDGNIEYLGRTDSQVKIRGFRVEVEGVEAVLASHPSVKAAAVLVKEGVGVSERRLVAYVLPSSPGAADCEEIKEYMKQRLPDYMVPTSFVVLESLPLMPTGKIDRRALQDLPVSVDARGAAATRSSPTEERLARLWEYVLGVSGVGANDDFFKLGGHSLIAVRLFAEIEREFGVRLPLAIIYRKPTVAGMVEELERARPGAFKSLVPLRAEGSRPRLFLVHAGDGEVYNYGELVKALGDDQPVYGLRAVGLYEDVPLPNSIEEMAHDYVREIRAVQPRGPYHLAGWCVGAAIAFEMALQLSSIGEVVGLVGVLDFEEPSVYRGARRRAARNTLLKEILFLGGDLLRYARKRALGMRLRVLSRVVGIEKLWMRALGIISADEVIIPGDAAPLPDTWRRAILNQLKAAKEYRPRRYDGVVTVFKREILPTISSPDPTDGWRRLAGGIVAIPIRGRIHGDMLKPPSVAVTAKKIRERIDWHEGRASSAPHKSSQSDRLEANPSR